MDDKSKRNEKMDLESVQRGNQAWWTSNTMSYDWRDTVQLERFSAAWFDEIDARFVHAARLYATDHKPFDRLLPFANLSGARVLEIGCGMGLHSELLARAGAKLSAVDLSPTSIEATTRRFALKGLEADIRLADAERLPFDPASFDFIWSWGVIHHSSRTGRIVREIARVLDPRGETRVMVYNRDGASAWGTFVRDYLARGRFLKETFDEVLWRRSDGFTARFYPREQFEDLFRTFFDDVVCDIMGQDADAVPLPFMLRRAVLPAVSEDALRRWQATRGSFLFLKAKQPS